MIFPFIDQRAWYSVELLAKVLHAAEYESCTTCVFSDIQIDISDCVQEIEAVPKLTEFLFNNDDDQLSYSLCLLLRVAPPTAVRKLFSQDVVIKAMRSYHEVLTCDDSMSPGMLRG